jgi:valyl-tRNA synthetase
MIKPAYQQPIDQQTFAATLRFFDILMKLVHPFMPFITEEIWQHIYDRKEGDSIMTESLHMPAPTQEEEQLLADVATMKQIVAGVRAVRNAKNIAPKEQLDLEIVGKNPVEALTDLIQKMANLSAVNIVTAKGEGSSAFLVGTTEFAVPLGNLIDTEAELQKMEAELKHLEGFLQSVQKKLQNERFVANAPAQVVELERKKQSDAETKIAALRESIAKLK